MKVVCREKKIVNYETNCKVDGYCCKKMKKAMNDVRQKCPAPEKGCGSAYYGDYVDYVSEFKLVSEKGETFIKIPTHYNDSWLTDYMRISFCPFCGEEIE